MVNDSQYQKHQAKLAELLTRIAAKFFNTENDSRSLITVTHCDLKKGGEEATLWLSIFPATTASERLVWAQSRIGELRYEIGETIKIKSIPQIHLRLENNS